MALIRKKLFIIEITILKRRNTLATSFIQCDREQLVKLNVTKTLLCSNRLPLNACLVVFRHVLTVFIIDLSVLNF